MIKSQYRLVTQKVKTVVKSALLISLLQWEKADFREAPEKANLKEALTQYCTVYTHEVIEMHCRAMLEMIRYANLETLGNPSLK